MQDGCSERRTRALRRLGTCRQGNARQGTARQGKGVGRPELSVGTYSLFWTPHTIATPPQQQPHATKPAWESSSTLHTFHRPTKAPDAQGFLRENTRQRCTQLTKVHTSQPHKAQRCTRSQAVVHYGQFCALQAVLCTTGSSVQRSLSPAAASSAVTRTATTWHSGAFWGVASRSNRSVPAGSCVRILGKTGSKAK